MNKEILTSRYPNVAHLFEKYINKYPTKYRVVKHDYKNSKRGVSLERILEILHENGWSLEAPKFDIYKE